jgi:uncharacterized protein YndB with AHSA1/START domain
VATEALAYVREVRIAASPAEVFPYFTEPQKLLRWQGVEAELDPRPGGAFRVKFLDGRWVVGAYLEVDPPSRLVYTWGWDVPDTVLPPGASTVEIDFVADGEETLVCVRHSGLPASLLEFHAWGWDQCLETLAAAVASR